MRLLLTLLLAPALAGASTFACQQTRGFHDGDTFACVPADGAAFVIRVAGLDAPETGQGFWRPSRDRLRLLAGPGTLVDCYKTDRYNRQLCRVRSPDGQDIVEQLIREGLAWHGTHYIDEQTDDERLRYAAAEATAQSERVGIWSQAEPMPPWVCRELRKARRRCR